MLTFVLIARFYCGVFNVKHICINVLLFLLLLFFFVQILIYGAQVICHLSEFGFVGVVCEYLTDIYIFEIHRFVQGEKRNNSLQVKQYADIEEDKAA